MLGGTGVNSVALAMLHEVVQAVSKAQSIESLWLQVIQKSRWILPMHDAFVFLVQDDDALELYQFSKNGIVVKQESRISIRPEGEL